MGPRRRPGAARQPAGPELPRHRARRARRRGEDHEPRLLGGRARRAGTGRGAHRGRRPTTPHRHHHHGCRRRTTLDRRRHERGTAQHPDHRVPRRRHAHRRRLPLARRPWRAWASSPRARPSRSRTSTTPGSTACCSGIRSSPIASSSCWRRIIRIRRGGSGSRMPRQRRGRSSASVAADLPRQAVHLDLTDDNVVCTVGARHPAARRAHRLRRRHSQLGRRRARDHDLVGAAPRGRRTACRCCPRSARSTSCGRCRRPRSRRSGPGRAARRRARRERRAPGAARRRRERICRGGHRPRVADLRAGDVGARRRS